MKTLIAVDAHLYRTPDNRIWAKTIYDYDFWKRYLEIFSDIVVLSRIEDVDYKFVENFLPSSGEKVEFQSVPMARSGSQYLFNLPLFIKNIIEISKIADCAIIRLPSVTSFFTELIFSMFNKPYVIEVVADPYSVYKENKFTKFLMTKHLKKACKRANGVSYVTQHSLQEFFPSRSKILGCESEVYFESYYSSIKLSEKFFFFNRNFDKIDQQVNLIHTANNINNYIKGHDTVIKIIKKLTEHGINAKITFIGDGKKKEEFINLSKELGIYELINFTGFISSKEEIRKLLIDADIFVFPTHAEGLPRAIIEAMAVGLPCISTPVNGIPELLPDEFLFKPNDIEGFTNKIIELISNKRKLNEVSKANIEKAKEYQEKFLQNRRNIFFKKLQNLTKLEMRHEN